MHAYTKMWGWAKAGNEIIEYIEQKKAEFEYLQQKKEGKLDKNFRIGR